ncbi:hypothetical protein Btru_042221 [Bulinus truncatus]|nr:hypothetical protein Btru_042221 [Bulinus truncatus]
MEVSLAKVNGSRSKWQFKSMDEVHTVANSLLRYILVNERSKRWRKVIQAYDQLLWVIDRKHFPKDYEPPVSYSNLLYECHFHLGLAYQRINHHGKSLRHYTEAMQAVSVPKGGCQAGCLTNSCMLTPLFARRAFAHCMSGNLSQALRDVEELTVLDMKNPDVYCVRALVRNSRKEEKQALQDLDYGLKLNPQHAGCSIVKRSILNPPSIRSGPEAQSLGNVDSFLHPFAMDFYDRMLYTLLVPHKLTVVNLNPDRPIRNQMELEIRRSTSTCTASSMLEPFRCGTVAPGDNVLAPRRRKDYGDAVRKHSSRPQTAEEYLESLKREIQRRQCTSLRNSSALNSASSHSQQTPARSTSSVTVSKSGSGDGKFTFQTPTSYTIPVFQRVNVQTAPRMYYRPWQGDRLPVADVQHPTHSQAFY